MAPFSTIKVWHLFISKNKTNHTTYSNQSNNKSCLLSFHQLIIPVWIKYQTYVSQISYRGEYHKQCIAIRIISWPSVSLHPKWGDLINTCATPWLPILSIHIGTVIPSQSMTSFICLLYLFDQVYHINITFLNVWVVSEWFSLTAFLWTADIEVHIVYISRVIIAYALES